MSVELAFSGQVALVTGASRGIGAAIALHLAQQGLKVVGTATSEDGAAKITQALSAFAGCQGAKLDVNNAAEAEALIDGILKQHGALHVLVNNAGITRDNLLLRMSDDDIADVLAANLAGAIRLSKLVLRGMMKARSGRIVNIGSVVGSSGNAGQANYAAAKAGLLGFSRSLAQEVGSRGITVNTVSPGFIDTDMTANLDEATRAGMLERIALGRLGAVDDIAAAVSFLCSPQAGYITGETLHVNGGLYMG